MKLIVHHMNTVLAVTRGLGSDTEHMRPMADVNLVGYAGSAGERGMEAVRKLWDARCYEAVAIIPNATPALRDDESGLDFAYYVTNSIDKPWTAAAHPNVHCLRPYGCRSTSVGDVIEHVGKDGSEFHVVASCGFIELK